MSVPSLLTISPQKLTKDDTAMDVDGDEDGTQEPMAVDDYGIKVDFSSIDEENDEDPAEALARMDKEITEKTLEIERMAPNMKAMERLVSSHCPLLPMRTWTLMTTGSMTSK